MAGWSAGRGWRRLGALAVILAGACRAPEGRGGSTAPGELAAGPSEERCRAADEAVDPARVLARAVAAMGSRPEGILHFEGVERTVQDYQSDRPYPPFFSAFEVQDVHYDPTSAAEYRSGAFVYPTIGPGPAREQAITDTAAYLVREGRAVPTPALFGGASSSRSLNPWAVVEDWSTSAAVGGGEECLYRDEWRTVLERPGPFGSDRLYLDRDSGFPVKLGRMVPHATWGQRSVEYLWSTWIAVADGSYFPSASFRMADGRVDRERTVGRVEVVALDEVTLPELPDAPAMSTDPWLTAWSSDPPDTVRIGDDAVLLAHWGYNEAVVSEGDTVYLLDATVSEARARQDSALIDELFPGHGQVALVVTDVAWPHIGGVRYWVSRGATVLAHPVSVPFLEELVAREWTLAPDRLQQRRNRGEEVPVRIRSVDAATDVAGGALRLVPIGGIGSEGALMVWVPGQRFLWAGDYIQTLDHSSLYAGEVIRAAREAGIQPERAAAQHLPLTQWSQVVKANPR